MDEPTIAQQVAASADLLKQYRYHKNRGHSAEHVALIRAAGNVWVTLARRRFGVSNFELVQDRTRKGFLKKRPPVVCARWLAVQLMHRNGFSFPDIGFVLHQDHTSAVLAWHRYDIQPTPTWATDALDWVEKVLLGARMGAVCAAAPGAEVLNADV